MDATVPSEDHVTAISSSLQDKHMPFKAILARQGKDGITQSPVHLTSLNANMEQPMRTPPPPLPLTHHPSRSTRNAEPGRLLAWLAPKAFSLT